MMCARLIRPEHAQNRLSRWVNAGFQRLSRGYETALAHALDLRRVVLALGAGILVACYFLYTSAPRELAPQEDQDFLMMMATADPNASIDQLERWTSQVGRILQSFETVQDSFIVNGFGGAGLASNVAFAGATLKPWEQRDVSVMALQPQLQGKLYGIAGLQVAVFPPPSLPGAGGGPPVQLVISANEEPLAVYELSQQLVEQARHGGKFAFIESDLKFDRLAVNIAVDRAKAADLGIDMRQLSTDLATMLSAGYVNFFSADGRSYRVIPQVERSFRLTPEQLTQYHVRTGSGRLVPLATLVRLHETVQPRAMARFDQLNSATLSGVPAPGVSLGEAVESLRQVAAQALPSDYVLNWGGESRQFVQEGTALLTAFALAVILMYLVLAAQFESFRDPAIMLVSVPMSLAGALLFFTLGVVTVNIYTQIGLLALIGSIIRHGILLVEFANHLHRREGLQRRQAMQQAAARRLRPILMTTIATLAGMLPLLIATGPGAESRFAIGLVLGAGMAIGTVFTLFVVPALYTVVAQERREPSVPPARVRA
jgi:multidrug efflux pump